MKRGEIGDNWLYPNVAMTILIKYIFFFLFLGVRSFE